MHSNRLLRSFVYRQCKRAYYDALWLGVPAGILIGLWWKSAARPLGDRLATRLGDRLATRLGLSATQTFTRFTMNVVEALGMARQALERRYSEAQKSVDRLVVLGQELEHEAAELAAHVEDLWCACQDFEGRAALSATAEANCPGCLNCATDLNKAAEGLYCGGWGGAGASGAAAGGDDDDDDIRNIQRDINWNTEMLHLTMEFSFKADAACAAVGLHELAAEPHQSAFALRAQHVGLQTPSAPPSTPFRDGL